MPKSLYGLIRTPVMRSTSRPGDYKSIVQISTDCFAAYPETVNLAFGPSLEAMPFALVLASLDTACSRRLRSNPVKSYG